MAMEPYRSTRRVWFSFLAAILLPIAGTVIRALFLQPLGARVLFITFYPAVAIAALFGGLLPGLLAAAVSAMLADYFWIEPSGFGISHSVDLLGVVVFLISCTVISGTSEAMHRALGKAHKSETEVKLATEREKAARAEARYAAELGETIRQKAEASALLDALFESAPIGIGILDTDFRYVRLNQALARMNGSAIEEHLGRRPDELLPELGDWDELLGCWREIIETGKPMLDVQISGKTPATLGKVGYWLENCYPMRVEGQTAGLAVTLIDITERKRADERERLEHRETAFANRLLCVFLELEGDEMFNQALAIVMEEMACEHGVFGYIPQPGHLICPSLSRMLDACEVEGKCIYYPPEKWKGLWAKALTEKQSLYTNEAQSVPTGHPKIHNNLAAPILFRGEVIGLLNLANKNGGYSDADRDTLDRIAARISPVLYAWIQKKLRENERKRAEEALRASEEIARRRAEELEKIMEFAPMAIWVSRDPQCGSILGNKAASRMYETEGSQNVSAGSTEGDVLNTDRRFFRAGRELRPEELPMQLAASRGEDVLNHELEALLPSGRRITMFGNASPLFDDQGRVRGCVGVYMDITERKRAEEALRSSRDMLKLVMESVPQGIFWKDSQSAYQGCNRVLAQAAGLKSPEEIVGKTDYDLPWSAEQTACFREDDRRIMEKDAPEYGIIEQQREADGKLAWVETNKVPLHDAQGHVIGILGTYQDITERKRMEEELRESHDQLEARVRERTAELLESREQLRYAASRLLKAQEDERKRIAQEIHDGLSAQIAAIRFMLERKLAADVGEHYGEAVPLEEIIRNVERAMEDTRRIMANLRPSLLDDLGLVPTVGWFCREFQKVKPEIRIEQTTEIEEDEIPEDLKVTIFRLLQESMNNVRKHSRADLVKISLCKEESSISFHIQDNGQGLDPREVSSPKEMGKEFGLRGMKERVELSGGRYELHSFPGQGVSIRAVWQT